MDRKRISSRQNPRIRQLTALRNSRERREQQRFLVEGLPELRQALAHEVWIETLLICPDLLRDPSAGKLAEEAEQAEVEVLELDPPVFSKISGRENPDGLIGVAIQREFLLEGAALPPNPLVLVLESVEKPGNLGAILRSADAAGVDCVICCDPATDIHNPQVIRNSRGLVFALPVFVAPWERVRTFLNEAGVATFGTTPRATTRLWDADLSGPVAFLLGSESHGLSETILSGADKQIVIPMFGSADSLNVSVSAALCLYEAARQRATS